MGTVRFVHCADLHLDTPFRGVSYVAPDVASVLNEATFRAYDNIIDLAIHEQVDCVLIAGDVYDSSDRSLRAQLRFQKGLQQLADHGIAAFVAFGNHDPLSGWSNTLKWPDTVHAFAAGGVDTCPLYRGGEVVATIHGVSFGKEKETEDLAARFVAPGDGLPAIAVLHSNVGGDTRHDNYAPTTVAELTGKGFDYWALGHVHAHRILKPSAPAIVYPGCTQSRQPNETGAKGCCLVTLSDGTVPQVTFVPVDIVRFHQDTVDVSGCASIDAARQAVVEHCRFAAAGADGRPLVVRLSLAGRTSMHRQLARAGAVPQLTEDLRDELLALAPWVWLERLTLETRAAYDIDVQRQRQDFVGDLISTYDRLLTDDSAALERLREEMESDLSSWGGRRYLEPLAPEAVREIAERAMQQTLDRVVEED